MEEKEKIYRLVDLDFRVFHHKNSETIIVVCREPENAEVSDILEEFLADRCFASFFNKRVGRKEYIWVCPYDLDHPIHFTDYFELRYIFKQHGVHLPSLREIKEGDFE